MTNEVTLLIDGDVLAFTAASAAQHIHEDSFGFVMPFAHKAEGEAILDNMITGLEVGFKSTHMRFILTDPMDNWRFGIMPAYKGHRDQAARPLLLSHLKDYLRSKYGAEHWPSLEADDVLGILCTEPQGYDGKRILVGKDKDFKTVPGYYHRLGDRDAQGGFKVTEVSPWEAKRFHIFQTLKGDAVDGYDGCPGIGDKRAEELLDNPVLLRPTKGVITRGPRKGQDTTKWVAEPTADLWAMVTSHYRKAGLTEQDALVTARLANILHHDQYNRETEEITLWSPDRLRN